MSIERHMEQLRRYISEPRRQHCFLRDKKLWNQICSSMDVIEDTQLAIKAYVDVEYEAKEGALYLATYGLLQAMYLQQDATSHLREALGLGEINFDGHPNLKQIRAIRNDATGHPTKRGKGKPSYHYISRVTLTNKGFPLMSCSSDNPPKFTDVSTYMCISDQENGIQSILTTIIETLKEEDLSHKKIHKL